MHAGNSSEPRPRPIGYPGLLFYPDREPPDIPGTIIEPSNFGSLQPRVEMIIVYGG